MTDPKDTTIEVLCEMVASLRGTIDRIQKVANMAAKHYADVELERDTYRDETEKLRAMIAEFRRRLLLISNESISLQMIPRGDVKAALDDCEREAFGAATVDTP